MGQGSKGQGASVPGGQDVGASAPSKHPDRTPSASGGGKFVDPFSKERKI